MFSDFGNPDRVRRSHRPRLALRVGAVAAAVLAVALPAAGDTPATKSQQARLSAAKTPPFGLPYLNQAIRVEQTTAEARKAKVHFTFPNVYLQANVLSCFAPLNGQYGFDDDSIERKACPKLGPAPLPPAYQHPDNFFAANIGGLADAYLVNHHGRGGRNTYGSFPAVKVRALVFGSIPVSATVHLEQTVTNGYIDPIKAQTAIINNLFPNDGLGYPGFPPVPSLPVGVPDGSFLDLVYKNQVDATLDLRLSDVAVDGRPVEIGAHCGTVSPVRLTVREPLGYKAQPPNVDRTRGTPGGFSPLDELPSRPGYFDGTASIPAFTRCGSRTEDLDPLLTALISSPANRVTGYLPLGILSPNANFCNSPVADNTCTPTVAAAQRRMLALAAAIAAHKGPATLRRLQAKLKPSDYVMPKVKADGRS